MAILEQLGSPIRDAVRRRSDQSQSTLGSEFLGRKKRAYNIDYDYVAKRAPGSEFLGKRMPGRQVIASEIISPTYNKFAPIENECLFVFSSYV